MRISILAAVFALALAGAPVHARTAAGQATLPLAPHGVIGVGDAQLTASFWLKRLHQPDRVIMDAAAIDRWNARVTELDPFVYDLHDLPQKLDRKTLRGWIENLSTRPDRTLYDVHGNAVTDAALDALVQNLALDAIPEQTDVRYGLVVHRAMLRTFPTTERVFSRKGDTDIDRFQESGMFPGTPVAVLHASADHQWLFVEAPRYRAWVQAKHVAIGPASEVFGYVGKTPFRVVTGASVDTVFTPEAPAVSQLQLDMGTRVPYAPEWPADKPVNGQGPYASYVIELPLRQDDGTLGFSHALLQKNADTHDGYLPLTRANIVRQAFKFLGERYGWGHAFDGRDCSGFVSDVYRSMGVHMPRNTSAQSVSPAANRIAFGKSTTQAERTRAVGNLEVGDLIYIPGHVMMVIGHLHGQPYVIHDTSGAAFRGPDGEMHHVKLNGVSVTPLLPLMANARESYIDHMTAIVRIRPQGTTGAKQ
ncbi:MAG TPA: SH3 domain-containing protein [Rhodanobacteraceae bacterium]|nr:SH3 domain-containing protein [Rhodanobacteraceae bacterium]